MEKFHCSSIFVVHDLCHDLTDSESNDGGRTSEFSTISNSFLKFLSFEDENFRYEQKRKNVLLEVKQMLSFESHFKSKNQEKIKNATVVATFKI